MIHPHKLSVIIPIGPGEHAWVDLVNDLALLPAQTEIVFVTLRQYSGFRHAPALAKLKDKYVHWVFEHPGRAQLLNAGAKAAEGEFFWFLHADSRFTQATVDALLKTAQAYPHSILYADLDFHDNKGKYRINTVGNWLRSHLFKLPSGQQGLCIPKREFVRIGGFSERITPGEEFAALLRARELRIPIRPIGASLTTRLRSYEQHGWLRTIVWRQYVCFYHALPVWWKLFKKKLYLA